MKLILSEDPDERSADLMAIGGLAGYLHRDKNQTAFTEAWLGFLLNIYDGIMEEKPSEEFTFSFRRAVKDVVRGMGMNET